MNIVAIVLRLGTQLKKGERWQASHKIDGKQTPKRPVVSEFDCGINEGRTWFEFVFSEDDGEHTLHGIFSVNNDGEEIHFDGADVESDDVIVSHRWRNADLRGVIEFEFVAADKLHRYRFDATLAKLIDL